MAESTSRSSAFSSGDISGASNFYGEPNNGVIPGFETSNNKHFGNGSSSSFMERGRTSNSAQRRLNHEGTYADDDSAVSSDVTADNRPSSIIQPIIDQAPLEPFEGQQLTRPNPNDDEENSQKGGVMPRNRREWIIVIAAIIMVLSVAIGLGLGLGLALGGGGSSGATTTASGRADPGGLPRDSGSDNLSPPSIPTGSFPPSSSMPPTSTFPTLFTDNLTDDMLPTNFSDAIEYHLISQEISSIASFRSAAGDGPLTAQQQARDFLVLLDFLPLGINDEDEGIPLALPRQSEPNFYTGAAYLRTTTPAYRVVQRFVVATLYYATLGDGWENFDRWVEPGVHECEWFGVKCEEISIPSVSLIEALRSPEIVPLNSNGLVDMTTERMVTEINLPENNLRGSLPQEVMALPYLQMLNLWSNDIGGQLPTQIGKLANLHTVYLDDNNFVGTIPTEIGLWKDIEDLSLYNNNIRGEIPTEVGKLKNLERLWLSNMKLVGSIPTQLGKLASLGYLYLDGNLFSGEVPAEFGDLKNLRELRLQNNDLVGSLPLDISHLEELEVLDLSSNAFTSFIPESWRSLVNLKYLKIANNDLRGFIPDFYTGFVDIEEIILSGNEFFGPIPSSIRACTKLTRLELHSNNIGGSIPTWIGDLSELVFFDVSQNRLSGRIPPQLSKLTNLKELRIHRNSLSGSIPCEFLDSAVVISADCRDREIISCGCCTSCT